MSPTPERRRRREEYERNVAHSRADALSKFPPRLLLVPCRDCGQDIEEPCRNLNRRTVYKGLGFYNVTPHPSRIEDGPPPKRNPPVNRWGDSYRGPWPPRTGDPGYAEMRGWLAKNQSIFELDSDEYRIRDWLLPVEVIAMTRWLRANASIFKEAPDGPGAVAAQDGAPDPVQAR